MQEQIISLFLKYKDFAIMISLLISSVIALLGVVPSFFVTGANLIVFGFWMGTLISFLGEALGAIIAFYLYRKGFRQMSQRPLQKYPKLRRLIESEGIEAFYLIISLRLLPFVPSGFITFAGAIGKVSIGMFAIASSIGKIPALIIEAYSVYQVIHFGWQGKLILTLVACYVLFLLIRSRK